MAESPTFESSGGGCAPDDEHVDDVPSVAEHKSGSSSARNLLEQSGEELTKAGASIFVNMLPVNVRAEAETVLDVQTNDRERHIAATNMLAGIPEAEEEEKVEEAPKMSVSMVEAFMLGKTI